MSKKDRKEKWGKEYDKLFYDIIFKNHPLETKEIEEWRNSRVNHKESATALYLVRRDIPGTK